MAYGFNGFIGLGKETSFGSAVAVTDYFEALSEDLSFNYDRFDTKNIVNTNAEPDDDVGVTRIAGTFLTSAHPVTLGHFLKGTFQTNSVVIVTSGFLWTNEFYSTAADFSTDTPVQPYTFEVFRDVTSSVRYGGCVFDQLELNYAPNQSLRAKATLIGRNMSVIAKSTATFPSSSSKPFKFDTASVSIGGTGTARVEALTLTVNNNLEGIPSLNLSSDVAKIRRRGPQTITLNGTLDFTDITEYLDFVNQTERKWLINVTKASSFNFTIDMPRVVYTAFPVGIPGRERLTVNFTGKAFYSTGSATAVKMSLTTVKSNY